MLYPIELRAHAAKRAGDSDGNIYPGSTRKGKRIDARETNAGRARKQCAPVEDSV
ncbi:MAG: hypothetical protein ACREE9_02935 [Stellaceae bacterium]